MRLLSILKSSASLDRTVDEIEEFLWALKYFSYGMGKSHFLLQLKVSLSVHLQLM